MNLIKDKMIAIIGGGPGGLTLARLLQLKGAIVKVYERDAHAGARPQGATLDLHEDSGLLALSEAGLMDAFKNNYRPGADQLRIVNKHAEIVYADEADKEGSRPEIDRGPLQKILLDALQPETVVWDSHFSGLEADGTGWQVTFKNQEPIYADLVIGADGAHSKLRPYVTPIAAFYSGITVVEGTVYEADKTIPELSKLLNGGKIFAMGDEKSLIVSSKGDGSLVFYTGCKAEEHWSKNAGIDFKKPAAVLEWFKQKYPGWDSIWTGLFEHASHFTPRPQYCMPFDQHWQSSPKLTLLGDAAHLMPPYAGEGVNMAMLDALELSQCLLNDDFEHLTDAISTYEKQMLSRASAVAQMTMEATKAFHSETAIEEILKVIGGE